MMLALKVDEEELTKRLLIRGKDSGRPDDSDESVIRKRIDVYNSQTLPLINYYSSQNKYYSINGIGTVEEIFERLCSHINV
jgi:adenylate kinase